MIFKMRKKKLKNKRISRMVVRFKDEPLLEFLGSG